MFSLYLKLNNTLFYKIFSVQNCWAKYYRNSLTINFLYNFKSRQKKRIYILRNWNKSLFRFNILFLITSHEKKNKKSWKLLSTVFSLFPTIPWTQLFMMYKSSYMKIFIFIKALLSGFPHFNVKAIYLGHRSFLT